jgi:hypothetical protein
MVFAREVSGPLTSLVKKLDAATAANKASKMGSFVVFCSDSESLEKQLKELADKESIKNTKLTIDNNVSGPPKYKVAKDADVTVVLYVKHGVQANYAFKKGEFKEADVEKIVGDLKKILPDKK